MQRTLEPELLDSLPHDHPDALHNRRDLRVINRLMGNHRWLARMLAPLVRPGERILELGAGTGELGVALAGAGVAVDGLDFCPRPAAWPDSHAWHVADLRTFDGFGRYAAVIGNLIFHQFSPQELQALGLKLRQRARIIIACEPARRRASQVFYRAIAPILGANHVSRHDGHVSIASGFRGDELPSALGLERDRWEIRCSATAIGAYRMIALRRA